MAASITEVAKYLVVGAMALSCARYQKPAPYTAAEVDRALIGVKSLRARCYAGSAAAHAGRSAKFDFSIQVSESGQVQAIPTFADPEEPALIECLRHGLNEVRFPPRARDRLDLHLELGAPLPTRANRSGRVANAISL